MKTRLTITSMLLSCLISHAGDVISSEEQLAAAYEAGDKKLIHQLHQKKSEAELECEFSEKEKRSHTSPAV